MTNRIGTQPSQPGNEQPAPGEGGPQRIVSVLVISAVILYLASIAVFAVAMAFFRPAVAGGPMLSLSALSDPTIVVTLQGTGLLLGGLAVVVGIAAVRHGWRPPATLLVGVGAASAALFVFLPPIWGDTDVLNYAVYGRIAALGHSPYVMTPAQLSRSGDPVGVLAPEAWRNWPTVYGPVATALQWAAAKFGGTSMAQIVFWNKVGNWIAFVATAIGLIRLTGCDPARQARACLLWVVNPLMLFWLIGDGHIDVWLALLAILALSVLQSRYGFTLIGGAVIGLVLGTGTALKTPFVLVALGIAWAARKSPRTIAAGLFGAAVITPVYLVPGALDEGVLGRRLTWNPRFLHLPPAISGRPAVYGVVLLLAGLVLATLLLRCMPLGFPAPPAVRPAAALVLAYLLVFPTEGPWYDALIFPLLALMPAGWLDYLMIAQCLLLSEMAFPGLPNKGAYQVERLVGIVSHLGVLLVPVAIVVMCLRRAWGVTGPGSSKAAAMAADQQGAPGLLLKRGRHRAPCHRESPSHREIPSPREALSSPGESTGKSPPYSPPAPQARRSW